MPYQSGLEWKEFQEEKLTESHRAWLRDACRPERCPYCGHHHVLVGHGFVLRYANLPEGGSMLLRVPCYRCKECGRCIRVLPQELHPHCNHLSETIIGALDYRLEKGHFRTGGGLDGTLQRVWYRRFLQRAQEEMVLLSGLRDGLRGLPAFSVLFRKCYRTVRVGDLIRFSSRTQRVFGLIVCRSP
jgi:hypothetical protein